MACCVLVGRGRMGGLWPVSLARIWERVGVVAVSTTLSPSQYLPCFLPPPTLMTRSPSKSWVLGSYSGPWTALAAVVYSVRRLWMEGLLYAERGSSGLKSTMDVALPLWAIAHAFTWEQGAPPCDADCETNSKIIRNYAEASVGIHK